MSLSAALLLAAAAAAPAQAAEPPHRGAVLTQARVSATILPAAEVRQASGLQEAAGTTPRHQLTRRGRTILVEFQ